MTLALNITGVRTLNGSGHDLVRWIREERGVGTNNSLNEGAVALATWLVAADMTGRAVGLVNFLTSASNEGETTRYLTGETEPDVGIANYIAELTDGAVRPSMFARPAEMPDAATPPVAQGRVADPSPPGDRSPDTIRITEYMTIERKPEGLVLVTSGWAVKIDLAAIAPLHAGIGRMLGREAA